MHCPAQRAHAARNQPLKVPLLGGLAKPRLTDRAVVNPLATAVGAQDPHAPHVHRKLALGIAQQPLDRDAQLPANRATTVGRRRHPELVQQRSDTDARDQIDGTLQMASAHPGVATIHPELLKRVEDLQPRALAQRRQIDFARRVALTPQPGCRKPGQIRLACGHPAPVTGLTQARSPERRQVPAPTAAPERRTRLRTSDVLRDRQAALLALGIARPAQPLAPPRRPFVTRGAAHQAKRLLRRTVDARSREQGELLKRALKSFKASPASLAQCMTLHSSRAVDDRTERITEHQVLGVWADDMRARVVSDLDQTRQIHRSAQPRQLVLP